MSFAVREAGAAERHALVDRAVVPDLDGLADDDAHAVVDEESAPDGRTRMDLDAGQKARDVREPAREDRNAPAMEPVDEAMGGDGLKAGIRQDDVEPSANGGIAFERGAEVAKKRIEGSGHIHLV